MLPSFLFGAFLKYNHAIKRHLKASSPKMLEIAQLRNSIQKGKYFDYFDFQFVDGFWFCWYLDDPKNDPIEAAKEINGTNETR